MSYSDFKQLIAGYPQNGYKVTLEITTLKKEGWTAERYLEHIENIERHKHETGAFVSYVPLHDGKGNLKNVVVTIHHPAQGNEPQKAYMICWKVNNLA